MKKIIIAIDGYAACGKSTTAKLVAKELHYTYIDTGAMYRAVTLYLLRNNVPITDANLVAKSLKDIHITFKFNPITNNSDTYLNGENVETEIRKMYVSEKVSEVSAIKAVREAMVAQQQAMGAEKGIVMDGRDIGTHVFPKADLKIFMQADFDTRVERRCLELSVKGQPTDKQSVADNLAHRDLLDTTRQESPLVKAEDATILDTTHLTIEEQVDALVYMALEKTLLEEVVV